MKNLLLTLIPLLCNLAPISGQIISQYIETSSGTTPKGVEIWNNTLSELNFSTNPLVIEKGTNGAIPSLDFTLSSGTLASGKVIVIGSSDMQTITEANGSTFYLKAFSFNGDDALVVKYGGTITDVLGIPGSDPGTAWTGNGVSTANQNIALRTGIYTGDTDGWSNPSARFETISTDNSMTGFGIAPLLPTPAIIVSPGTLSDFKYLTGKGPSASQSFTVSGELLSNDITIAPSASYEISTDNVHFQTTPTNLTQSGGDVPATTIFVRLKRGLPAASYSENVTLSSTGVSDKDVLCTGYVSAVPNAWINEFHYDNAGSDENEFVEIVIQNAGTFNLSDFSLSLYDGGDGTTYNSQTINNFTTGQTVNGFTYFTWFPSSIQNGPDGFSLSFLDSVLQFISYEGKITATDGPANALTSDNILASEGTTTPVGLSLQLYGSGNIYSHFTWSHQPETPGEINAYQSIGEYIPPVPFNFRLTILAFILIASTTLFRRRS